MTWQQANSVKAVGNVDLAEPNGSVCGIRSYDLGENAFQRLAELHGFRRRQAHGSVVDAGKRVVVDNQP